MPDRPCASKASSSATSRQEGSLSGYFLQSTSPDEDPLTSEGVFVYAPGDAPVEVSVGDIVNVAGVVSEYASPNGTLTEITAGDAEVCATGTALPEPATLTLPATPEQREALEGMYVTLPQSLTILEHFEFGRYGTVEVGTTRQVTPTAIVEPGEEAIALAERAGIGADHRRRREFAPEPRPPAPPER